jgi:hypothetical protein
MSRLDKFWELPRSDRALLVEAGFWLGVAQLAIRFLPFHWIKRGWGEPQAPSPGETGGTSPALLLDRISWAVATASRHLPWDCLCLAQAMAGKTMLRRRGISSTLYLGLAKDGTSQVLGHAWLSCGERILTGQKGMEGFTVIATLIEEGK